MRRITLTGTITACAVAALVGVPMTQAHAATAIKVPTLHVASPGSAGTKGAGGTGSATVQFTGSTTVYYTKGYVNDTCPADGLGVWVRAYAKTSGGVSTGAWHKDTGGCDGTPATKTWGTLKSSKGTISAAGVEVCLYDSSTRVKCSHVTVGRP